MSAALKRLRGILGVRETFTDFCRLLVFEVRNDRGLACRGPESAGGTAMLLVKNKIYENEAADQH